MYTDIYYTNILANQKSEHLVFFQDASFGLPTAIKSFACIKSCPPGWLNKIRIVWDVSFRFKYKSGNLSQVYYIRTGYRKQSPFFLISKEGITSIQQDIKNGHQMIHVNRLKGSEFSAVQLYRGKLLIEELAFHQKQLSFQIDSKINITNKTTDKTNNSITIDFTGLKSVHLVPTTNKKNILCIDAIKKW